MFLEHEIGPPAYLTPHHSSVSEATDKINDIEKALPPKVISGSSDGRIRLWEGQGNTPVLLGFIAIANNKSNDNKSLTNENVSNLFGSVRNASAAPPHGGVINSLQLDDRSRHLVSACSFGEVLLWRTDSSGWYQLLRKLKREGPGSCGVLSLAMHPDKVSSLLTG